MSDQKLPPDEYLSAEQVQSLHSLLQDKMASMLSESRESVNNLTEQREVDADHVDVAVNESSRDLALRMADRDRRLLRKIRYALDRMRQGEYGVCESCGGEIAYARLLARPEATLCIDCKTEVEQLERPRSAFV